MLFLDYASVLSGPGVPGAAIGRLHFRKKTLQWSLVSSERLSAPIQLTFTDPQDNILDEFPTPITDLYNRYIQYNSTYSTIVHTVQ